MQRGGLELVWFCRGQPRVDVRAARHRPKRALAVLPITVLQVALQPFFMAGSAHAQAPEVSEIGGWNEAREGEGLAFGVGVFNASGESLDFEWDLGDGDPAVGGRGLQAVTHRYRDDGTYTVRLQVRGSQGFTADRTVDVLVRNVAPSIDALSYEEPARPGQSVDFEATATDPGDDDLTYTWDFGDGSAPRSGVDLADPTHVYQSPGRYDVTLVVRDDDGLESQRTVPVAVNPGFLGNLTGDVALPVEGVSGKASLMNALPGSRAIPLGSTPLFTGAAPMGGGVADLREPMGICMVMAGFWDDDHRVHVNFLWTPNADSIFAPRRYAVRYSQPADGTITPDQLVVNALVLEIEPSYEDTKRGAESMEVFEGGVRRLLSNIGGLFGLMGRGGAAAPNPGTNWQLTSLNQSGTMIITSVTPERISGYMIVGLMGAFLKSPGGSGSTNSVHLAGDFAWELDEVARANLLRCGDRPFSIESHSPKTEEINVDFRLPEVTLTFTQPYQSGTVNDQTFQVGYLNESGQFVPIAGTLVHDPELRTIHFSPDEALLDAVYYHGRVMGGPTGVRSVGGDPLPEDYEWRFVTVVDLLPNR